MSLLEYIFTKFLHSIHCLNELKGLQSYLIQYYIYITFPPIILTAYIPDAIIAIGFEH
jgi:hypothetical protein